MARPFKGITFWDRVWIKTRITEKDCIEFTGHKDECGYGRINREGKLVRLHREVWQDHNGPIPEGICIRHRCDNPSCINISHLLVGTHAENMRDKAERGRVQDTAGEKNPSAKLKQSDIAPIRYRIASGETCYGIARDYGVSGETILAIKHVRTWSKVA